MYKIQLEAPTPKAVLRDGDINGDEPHPNFYGYEYHGILDHKQSETILNGKCDGSYLVRRSPGASDYFTLSLRFNDRTKHYKIYYKSDCGHYLKEDFKRFESIHDLVADGLVNFYMQIHAAPIIQSMFSQTRNSYQQSPYMTLHKRKLRALSNDLQKGLKIDNQPASDNVTTTAVTSSLNKVSISNKPDVVAEKPKEIQIEVNGNGNGNGSNQPPTPTNDENDVLPVVYQKPHKFQVQTFKGLTWCELCANFIFGISSQGKRCTMCGKF